MKKLINFAFMLLMFSSVATLADDTPPIAQITFCVKDDFGNAVNDVPVSMTTAAGWVPDTGGGRSILDEVMGNTDSNGNVTLQIPCKSGNIRRYGVLIPPGSGLPYYKIKVGSKLYYRDLGAEFHFSRVVDDQWQPWNPKVDIVLKEVINPIPMYAKRVDFSGSNKIPNQDVPIGYDLVISDWVSPYGKGETADLVFALHSDPEKKGMRYWGSQPRPYRIYDVSLNMRFSNKEDGLQTVYAIPAEGSIFHVSREAPVNGYIANLSKHVHNKTDNQPYADKQEDRNFFFRIRSKEDVNGIITNALYGKIYGDIELSPGGQVRFTYYLNPTPNDRNLEFDPGRNLFKNLSANEQVQDP